MARRTFFSSVGTTFMSGVPRNTAPLPSDLQYLNPQSLSSFRTPLHKTCARCCEITSDVFLRRSVIRGSNNQPDLGNHPAAARLHVVNPQRNFGSTLSTAIEWRKCRGIPKLRAFGDGWHKDGFCAPNWSKKRSNQQRGSASKELTDTDRLTTVGVCSSFRQLHPHASHRVRPTRLRGHQFVTAIRRLRPFRCLHDCSSCFRLERFAGWGLHPLESVAFSRRTPKAVIR
jgi:hypothetical protein